MEGVGDIPMNTTEQDLIARFAVFGILESTRVLNCGFINFERIVDAIDAKNALDNTPLNGTRIRINYAKTPSTQSESDDAYPEYKDQFSQFNHDIFQRKDFRHRSNSISSTGSMPPTMQTSPVISGFGRKTTSKHPDFPSTVESLFQNTPNTMISNGQSFAPNPVQNNGKRPSSPYITQIATPHLLALAGIPKHPQPPKPLTKPVLVPKTYADSIPPLPDSKYRLDPIKLRDTRKRLDAYCAPHEVEQMYDDYHLHLTELSTDFIGNVVIQKIVERGTDSLRFRVIQGIGMHLAGLGVHKNGTWVAQKLIEVCTGTSHTQLFERYLQPYIACLMLDPFGNYVVQGCLRFTNNQFIFDCLSDKCADIGMGRFGARAMRSILEFGTKRQQKQVAISIVKEAYVLLMDCNGIILLTWLLDFSGLPGRFRVLAPQFVPHLAEICLNKTTFPILMKIILQSVETDARDLLLNEIFSSTVLRALLSDPTGPPLLQKLLSTADHKSKTFLADRSRLALATLPSSAGCEPLVYKRLLEELTGIGSAMGDESVSPLVDEGRGMRY